MPDLTAGVGPGALPRRRFGFHLATHRFPAQVLQPGESAVAAARGEPESQVPGKRRGYPHCRGPIQPRRSAGALQISPESIKSHLIYPLYRLRWQIELIFKACKNSLNADEITSCNDNIFVRIGTASCSDQVIDPNAFVSRFRLYRFLISSIESPEVSAMIVMLNFTSIAVPFSVGGAR